MSPLISVCIPTYNNGPFIVETLQSVLKQSYQNIELIIVDDCSTDDTIAQIKTIQDPRIRLVQNEKNLGMHGNWQKSLDLAKGDFMKLVCGDDLLAPKCLELQLAVLNDPKQSDVAIVGCKRAIITADGKTSFGSFYKLLPGKYSGKTAMRLCAIFGTNLIGEPMTVMFRGALFREKNIQLGSNNYMIDIDLYSKLMKYGKLVMLPENLASFRIHGESMTGVLGMKKRSAFFREFINESRLRADFGLNAFFRFSAYSSEFVVSRMRALVLKMSAKGN
jgi:glycosyltransferase involved in cell wall biosynthesis